MNYYLKTKSLISAFLMVFLSLQAFGQKVTVNVKNTPISSVLKIIQKDYGYSYAVKSNDLDLSKLVSVSAENQTLADIVKGMFDSTGQKVDVDIDGKTLSISKRINVQSSASLQANVVKGIVLDNTGEPIIGAGILQKGTNNGTITDLDGHFEITVPEGATLVVSSIGFLSSELIAGKDANVSINLIQDTEVLDEVVVVGFGSQKKVNLTGAVSTVGSKDISARPINSVVDALQGLVPGLNFSTGSGGGALNSDKTFNIRGASTIGSGSSVTPLVLIDGMEGDMNTLNPQDIENISVLKDASSSSIYGSRAAGGVILITTKSGVEGKTTVNYNNSFRFNSPLNMPEMMDSYTWANYTNLASINSGSGAMFSDAKLADIKAAQNDPNMQNAFPDSSNQWSLWLDPLPLGNVDWLKEHFGNSFSQEHTLSINGGSDKLRYYFSANYLGLDGAMRHADDNKQRYAVTSKIDVKLAKWARMTYSMRFNRTDYTQPSYTNDGGLFYHNVCRYWPIMPAIDPNGHYTNESMIEQVKNGGKYIDQVDVLAQQLAFRLTPLKGWTINTELNYRIKNQNLHQDMLTVYAYDCDDNPYAIANETSEVSEYNYKSNYFNLNIYSDYSISIKDAHNIKVMAGFQSELLRQRTMLARQYGILSGLPTLNTTSDKPYVSGGYDKWTTAGFFGRLNYDYKGRYLLEANIRYDGASRFLRNNRWGAFPSFSAGWNIAQEDFWENIKGTVNMLKFRASWGLLGNENTDNWYPFYPVIGYSQQGSDWLVNGAKPNSASQPALVSNSLTWEKNRTWEIGLDWGAFDNRLTGSFGFFNRKTYDMVGPAMELPDVLGTSVPKTNNLDMTSRGWDLQIGWRDMIGDFSYGASLVLSDNTVTIDKYPNESNNLGSYYPGAKLGDIWGYTTVGIASSQEEMNKHLAAADQSSLGGNWTAGDIMYADLNGDGKVNSGEYSLDNHGDLSIIGNSTPRYNFGLDLNASWKGFDLKVFLQGTMKRDQAIAPGQSVFWGAVGIGKWQQLGFKSHEDYWTPENTDSYYPRPDWNGTRNTEIQTRYLQNAAYCRLKNVTLGYTLPRNFTDKFHVQNLRVFVSGENLLTITKYTKLSDPELVGIGQWGFGKTYPLSKTVSLGLSVTL